jgi:hypothetical protein
VVGEIIAVGGFSTCTVGLPIKLPAEKKIFLRNRRNLPFSFQPQSTRFTVKNRGGNPSDMKYEGLHGSLFGMCVSEACGSEEYTTLFSPNFLPATPQERTIMNQLDINKF